MSEDERRDHKKSANDTTFWTMSFIKWTSWSTLLEAAFLMMVVIFLKHQETFSVREFWGHYHSSVTVLKEILYRAYDWTYQYLNDK